MLGLELREEVGPGASERSTQPLDVPYSPDAHILAVLLDGHLVACPDAETVTDALGDHHLTLRPYTISHTDEYNSLTAQSCRPASVPGR